MSNSNNIEKIIQNVFFDIKAEAIIGDLIENGLEWDDFVGISQGILKRRFGRDIDTTKEKKLENGRKIIEFYLNRDGLYDSLPEGLFHEETEKSLKEADKIISSSKKLKKEEKEARDFFLPFENELFSQRVKLELQEREILSRFNENLFDDIYPEFWNFDISLDRKLISRMVRLLHFSHRIAGNCKLTEECLESILEENVKVKITDKCQSENRDLVINANEDTNCVLGRVNSGVNFVCGESFSSLKNSMVIDIGPIKKSSIEGYLENGAVAKFLDCFYDYFVPAELDVMLNIHVEKSEQSFILHEDSGPVLGYESAI